MLKYRLRVAKLRQINYKKLEINIRNQNHPNSLEKWSEKIGCNSVKASSRLCVQAGIQHKYRQEVNVSAVRLQKTVLRDGRHCGP